MRHRAAFIAGAGLGYWAGTPGGRAQLTRVAHRLRAAWEDPHVQDRIDRVGSEAVRAARGAAADVQDRAADVQDRASDLRDKAAELRGKAVDAARGAARSARHENGPSDGSTAEGPFEG